jgi:tripartite-type tricarboxylate transporter receptor subunit TctC
LRAPDVIKRNEAESAIPGGGTPAEYAAFIAKEQARWKTVVERAQIKPG